MDLTTKLPGMTDSALDTLNGNASRLLQVGTTAQKKAATALMPALEQELANRREAKVAAKKASDAAKPTPVRKRAVKKVAS
ncbi:histone H1-like protein [Skermanella stibiiresistens SB22]|uniref:Histone H1-like protein n=1 Tax=Skermanella stibiiresistens SB22 TaxID=1385369 RepID=W9H078_9PROT|nr:hypothetical protein [Skermanella stibiiresistens]EWY39595.1 histone H1-like protein [Skermanella stibiiresistens SB22]